MDSLSVSNPFVIQQTFIQRVYGWMFGGLVTTGVVATAVAANPSLLQFIASNSLIFWGLLIAELLLVFSLSVAIQRMSSAYATMMFLLYAALNGVTLSLLFLVYTNSSIATTFFVTALTFGAMSLYGYTTKRDLTSIGNLALMALFGLILASVVNIFLVSSALYWVTTYAGILIFVGLTAYDTQKIKQLGMGASAESESREKEAVIGALTLYLDFINLFLDIIRIVGKRR